MNDIISCRQVSRQLERIPRRDGGEVRILCCAYLFVSATSRSHTSTENISEKNRSGGASAGRDVYGPVGCEKAGHCGSVSLPTV